MSNIIRNEKLPGDFYLMEIRQDNTAKIGQFYMIKSWDKYPLLNRPISVYNATSETLTFLYKVVGEGTKMLSEAKIGDRLYALGPYGQGFPIVSGKVAMVGGGVGIAPLYYASKKLKEENINTKIDIYLGFSDLAVLEDDFREFSDNLYVDVGGFVTDLIDTTAYDYIFSCGPEIMMKVLYKKYEDEKSKAKIYFSMESRMACGIGICLGCSCKTKSGNKTICQVGPVFLGEEVFNV